MQSCSFLVWAKSQGEKSEIVNNRFLGYFKCFPLSVPRLNKVLISCSEYLNSKESNSVTTVRRHCANLK